MTTEREVRYSLRTTSESGLIAPPSPLRVPHDRAQVSELRTPEEVLSTSSLVVRTNHIGLLMEARARC